MRELFACLGPNSNNPLFNKHTKLKALTIASIVFTLIIVTNEGYKNMSAKVKITNKLSSEHLNIRKQNCNHLSLKYVRQRQTFFRLTLVPTKKPICTYSTCIMSLLMLYSLGYLTYRVLCRRNKKCF